MNSSLLLELFIAYTYLPNGLMTMGFTITFTLNKNLFRLVDHEIIVGNFFAPMKLYTCF